MSSITASESDSVLVLRGFCMLAEAVPSSSEPLQLLDHHNIGILRTIEETPPVVALNVNY